jgi:hypothetical protein
MRASHTVGGILRLAGFKNVKSKVSFCRFFGNDFGVAYELKDTL